MISRDTMAHICGDEYSGYFYALGVGGIGIC